MEQQPDDPTPPNPPPVVLPAADLPPVVLSAWEPPKPPLNTRAVLFFAVLGLGAVAYVLLLFIGKGTREFASAGLEVLPFLGLVLLAYAGERSDAFRLLAIVYWGLLVLAGVLFITGFTVLAEVNVPVFAQLQEASKTGRRPPVSLSNLFLPHGLAHIAATFVLAFTAAVVAVAGFAPAVRRGVATLIPGFDRDSFVHAIALATVVALTGALYAPLLVTGDPPFLTFIQHFTDPELGGQGAALAAAFADENMLLGELYSLAWLVPVGLVAVGWPLHRTLPEAMRRVGFVVPSGFQVAFALALAIVLAAVMPFVDFGIGRLWDYLHWPRTDEKAFEALMKAVTNPLGAVVIGVVAGVGEEMFARGILQPRLGILLSNLFFTALHALQYNWDGLLSVFVAGLILGLVRKKTNTTTSAIVHGTYDFLLILASYYQFDITKQFGW